MDVSTARAHEKAEYRIFLLCTSESEEQDYIMEQNSPELGLLGSGLHLQSCT